MRRKEKKKIKEIPENIVKTEVIKIEGKKTENTIKSQPTNIRIKHKKFKKGAPIVNVVIC